MNELVQLVKQDKFYVPRDYQTIGGAWTVDTWKRGVVTLQVMDEGYTKVIQAPGLRVFAGYNGKTTIRFEVGDESMIAALIQTFKVEE